MSEWISVKYGVPEEDQRCLVVNIDVGSYAAIRAYFDKGDFFPLDSHWVFPLKITHWMPLPEPPEVKDA